MDQREIEHMFITAVKSFWDEGMRSSKSQTGRYFKASDVLARLTPEQVDNAREIVRKPRHDPLRAVALALSYMTGGPFNYNGKVCYVDKYASDGSTVYRFVEKDNPEHKNYTTEEYIIGNSKCYRFVEIE